MTDPRVRWLYAGSLAGAIVGMGAGVASSIWLLSIRGLKANWPPTLLSYFAMSLFLGAALYAMFGGFLGIVMAHAGGFISSWANRIFVAMLVGGALAGMISKMLLGSVIINPLIYATLTGLLAGVIERRMANRAGRPRPASPVREATGQHGLRKVRK